MSSNPSSRPKGVLGALTGFIAAMQVMLTSQWLRRTKHRPSGVPREAPPSRGSLVMAHSAEKSGRWGEAAVAYKSSADQTEDAINAGEAPGSPEEARLAVVDLRLAQLRCTLEMRRCAPAAHDIAREVRSEIEGMESKIRALKILAAPSLWNKLELAYGQLEQASILQGRDYEAEEFNFAMMRAHRRREHAFHNWRAFLGLLAWESLVGYGHRPMRVLGWIATSVVLWSLLYLSVYPQWAGAGGDAPQYLHCLYYSAAVLFAPELVKMPQVGGWLGLFVFSERILSYVMTVGLIGVVVNKLAGRRKW
jgi:hypothetical protein